MAVHDLEAAGEVRVLGDSAFHAVVEQGGHDGVTFNGEDGAAHGGGEVSVFAVTCGGVEDGGAVGGAAPDAEGLEQRLLEASAWGGGGVDGGQFAGDGVAATDGRISAQDAQLKSSAGGREEEIGIGGPGGFERQRQGELGGEIFGSLAEVDIGGGIGADAHARRCGWRRDLVGLRGHRGPFFAADVGGLLYRLLRRGGLLSLGLGELLFIAAVISPRVHEHKDAVMVPGWNGFVEHLTDGAEVGAAGHVGQHDRVGLGFFEQGDDVVNVQVLADVGALAVFRLEEGAFGDKDFGVQDIGAVEVRAPGGVAGVAHQGHFEGVGDFGALLFQFDEFFLRQADEFRAELAAVFDRDEAEGGDGVSGFKSAEEDVVFDFELAVRLHGHEVVGRALGLEIDPGVHDVSDRALKVFVAQDGSGAHALEVAL